MIAVGMSTDGASAVGLSSLTLAQVRLTLVVSHDGLDVSLRWFLDDGDDGSGQPVCLARDESMAAQRLVL